MSLFLNKKKTGGLVTVYPSVIKCHLFATQPTQGLWLKKCNYKSYSRKHLLHLILIEFLVEPFLVANQ